MPGKTENKTVTDTGPWKPSQDALTGVMKQAQQLGGNSGTFAPVAGQQTQDAWGMMESLARGGPNATQQALSPLLAGSAQGYQTGLGQLTSAANGDNLDPMKNQALMSVLNQSNDLVANRVNQQFSGAGRYGGNGANTQALTNAIGQNTNNLVFDQYNRERSNQMQAAGTLHSAGYQGASMAPLMDQANMANASLLHQVGSERDNYATAQRQAPLAALQWQKDMIAPIGAMGQSGQTSQTQTSNNPVGTILGGAMALGGMASGMPNLGAGLGGLANGGWQGMRQGLSGMHNPSFWNPSVRQG